MFDMADFSGNLNDISSESSNLLINGSSVGTSCGVSLYYKNLDVLFDVDNVLSEDSNLLVKGVNKLGHGLVKRSLGSSNNNGLVYSLDNMSDVDNLSVDSDDVSSEDSDLLVNGSLLVSWSVLSLDNQISDDLSDVNDLLLKYSHSLVISYNHLMDSGRLVRLVLDLTNSLSDSDNSSVDLSDVCDSGIDLLSD